MGRGLNIMAFCKEYNALTADKIGSVVPVEVTFYEDKSFSLKLKTTPASNLIKKAANLEKGSENAAKKHIATITLSQLEEIAQIKLVDLNCDNIESATRTILGTCNSMGVKVLTET